jgi:hypothetical protein
VRDGFAPLPTGSDTDSAIIGRLVQGGFRVALDYEREDDMVEIDGLDAWAKAIEIRKSEIKNRIQFDATELAKQVDPDGFTSALVRYIQLGARWLKWAYHPSVRIEAHDRNEYWDMRKVKGPKS